MTLDRRVRIINERGRGLDIEVWAMRRVATMSVGLSLDDPLPDNELRYVWRIRWDARVGNLNLSDHNRIQELPDGKRYRVSKITEVGRRRFLDLETAIL